MSDFYTQRSAILSENHLLRFERRHMIGCIKSLNYWANELEDSIERIDKDYPGFRGELFIFLNHSTIRAIIKDES